MFVKMKASMQHVARLTSITVKHELHDQTCGFISESSGEQSNASGKTFSCRLHDQYDWLGLDAAASSYSGADGLTT